MLSLNGSMAANGWCIYTLHDQQGQLVFIWPSKIASVCSLRDVLSNPGFQHDQMHTLQIVATYATQREAQGAFHLWIRANGMPALNKTVRWSRRSRVRCEQTGQVWQSAAKCASELGINQSQLSQHLRRNPSFKSIKGMTFSNIPDEAPRVDYSAQAPR